ncbi:unnamed protein product [Miscanthus lutarioriparius]|uniref:Uncharacterized protein n=1 Tax=Miscanthus lutarioriparius TaxID=422564 RepID=A0A811MFC7_9POAL|nr:unnamed protein product [Miscanthus lutarioriparius]
MAPGRKQLVRRSLMPLALMTNFSASAFVYAYASGNCQKKCVFSNIDLNKLPPDLDEDFLDAFGLDYVTGNPTFCTQVPAIPEIPQPNDEHARIEDRNEGSTANPIVADNELNGAGNEVAEEEEEQKRRIAHKRKRMIKGRRGRSLTDFVRQYQKIQEKCLVAQDGQDFRTDENERRRWSRHPLEKHASTVYTKNMFYKFSKEFEKTTEYDVKPVGPFQYWVEPNNSFVYGYGKRNYLVTAIEEEESYCCVVDGPSSSNVGNPPKSKAKGHRKEKAHKKGINGQAKRKNGCSVCRSYDHNAQRCLDKPGREVQNQETI